MRQSKIEGKFEKRMRLILLYIEKIALDESPVKFLSEDLISDNGSEAIVEGTDTVKKDPCGVK